MQATNWITTKELAKIKGISERAFKYGQMRLIPRDTQKPPEKERRR